MADVTLRDIRPFDLEALYELDQLCFEPGIAYSRGELKKILGSSEGFGVVAEVEGEIGGFAAGCLSAGAVGHVMTLDVAPGRRRLGVGRSLFTELMRRFAEAGVREVRLEVDPDNAAAVKFYEGFGFQRTRIQPHYYGRGRAAWVMKKKM
jgi:ribosomal-protein-alanine N-acetyltransferase